jgi:UDP-4-amino-4,6-dideoxy-N-acetyl-beta-L-altrosamine transaminase
MIPYGRQNLNAKDKQSVAQVLNSDFLTQGPAIEKFEAALAKQTGTRYAVAVANGTAALHLAYLAAGLGQDAEVITTPNTFVATTNMLLAIGAKPVFADLRLDTYNLDETKIEKLITKKTKAIAPVDFAGQPCAYQAIKAIAKKYNLLIIEDAAHALGAKYNGQPIGGLADLTTFSFHPVKAITTGEGGAIVTNDKHYYDKLKSLRSHGIHKDKNGFNVMTEFGYNYRLTDLQAALGTSQLTRLDEFIKTRHRVVSWYEMVLSEIPEIILPQELAENYSGWHLYVIRVKNSAQRLPLTNHLKQNGIGVNFHYPAVYSHPYYRAHGYKNTHCPNAENYHQTAITLPLHTQLTKKEVNYIGQTIKKFFISIK